MKNYISPSHCSKSLWLTAPGRSVSTRTWNKYVQYVCTGEELKHNKTNQSADIKTFKTSVYRKCIISHSCWREDLHVSPCRLFPLMSQAHIKLPLGPIRQRSRRLRCSHRPPSEAMLSKSVSAESWNSSRKP